MTQRRRPAAMNLTPHHDPLNAQQKEAIRLRETELLTRREIATRMGVSPERVQQVLATARQRLRDCEAHGEEALCLLPKRVREFLERHDLATRPALRAAIECGRLTWNDPRKRLLLDGRSPRNVGWQSWQAMCEWVGLPRPEAPPVSGAE